MKTKILGLTFALSLSAAVGATSDAGNWAQWRGPLANGVAPEADPPTEWSETKNVKWKVPLQGAGDSTPIIWGNRVFILTAVSTGKKTEEKPAEASAERPPDKAGGPAPGGAPPPGERPPGEKGKGRPGGFGGRGGFGGGGKPTEPYQFVVMCIDRNTGKTLWQKTAREEVPHEGTQQNNTFASASPITDGKVVIAFFGSRGLYCYDMDGNLKWSKQLGQMRTRNGFGEGASPTLHGDMVVVPWDDENDNDFIVAFNKNDGKELWRTPRNEPTGWSTPLVVEHDKKTQVVVNATQKARSYDLATGAEIWSCGGQTDNAIPSPVADANTVYLTSGFRGSALYAVKLGAKGDVSQTDAVLWKRNQNTPYVPSPLLTDNLLYLVKGNNGILSCVDTKTGEPKYEEQRLEGIREIYASPVAAKDRIYVLSRDGKCVVLKKGPKLEVIATNTLDSDRTDASIALAGKELFIRSQKNLYCIAEK